MDVVLITVAVVAMIAATGFGIAAWRALQDQRGRSAARVAALASAIDTDQDAGDAMQPPVPVAVSPMFRTAPGAAVSGRPLIKTAIVGAMGVALIVVVAMASRGGNPPESAEIAAPAATTAAPLELISMRHTRNGDALTVSGLVRNPRAGTAVTRVAAVVFAFDREQAFVASARAPLDFTLLAPGEESPFVVTLTNVADVSRYRVSFRTDAGVVRHIDRRPQTQLAMNQ